MRLWSISDSANQVARVAAVANIHTCSLFTGAHADFRGSVTPRGRRVGWHIHLICIYTRTRIATPGQYQIRPAGKPIDPINATIISGAFSERRSITRGLSVYIPYHLRSDTHP